MLQIIPPESFFKSKQAKVNEDLTALWQEDGWACYYDGLFWTVDPREFSELYKDWKIIPRSAMIFGRNAFGELFVLDNDEIFFLSIQANLLLSLGKNMHIFLNSTLEPDPDDSILDLRLFKAVRKRLGDLEVDECYGLFPALALGGNDEDSESYKRAKLFEYLAIIAQIHS